MKQELTEASMPNPQHFIRYYVKSDWSSNCDILEIPYTSLYNTYKEWCNKNGESKILSNNKFGMKIKQFALKTHVRHSGNLTYCYILAEQKL
jgi:phage/plasmid-associated DNA primase